MDGPDVLYFSSSNCFFVLQKPSSSKKLEWNPSFKQAVYFLTPKDTSSASNLVKLDYCVEFSSALGSMDITISGSS